MYHTRAKESIHVKSLTAIVLSAVAALALAGCFEELENDQRYGQFLSPADVEDCPEGCVPYVTAPNDVTFLIAKRAYGKGHKLYLVHLKNADLLQKITKPDGTLEAGKILFVPCDEIGRPLNTRDPGKKWYGYGGG